MKDLTKSIAYCEAAEDELSDDVRALIDAAKRATKGSYAPYSNFHVGAAVRLSTGEIVTGANQENGAYPSGLCAERTAVFAAGATHPNSGVIEIAIAAETGGEYIGEPITPCGACLQVLLESEMRAGCEMQIYLYGKNRVIIAKGVKSFLPFAFTLK